LKAGGETKSLDVSKILKAESKSDKFFLFALDGKIAFLGNNFSSIYVIDAKTLEIQTISLKKLFELDGGRIRGIDAVKVGKGIVLTATGSNYLFFVDLEHAENDGGIAAVPTPAMAIGEILKSEGALENPSVEAIGKNVFFVAEGFRTLYRVDFERKTWTGGPEFGRKMREPRVRAVGELVYLWNDEEDTIYAFSKDLDQVGTIRVKK